MRDSCTSCQAIGHNSSHEKRERGREREGGREGEREREGERARGKEGERERGREGERERERERERGREGGRAGERQRGRERVGLLFTVVCICVLPDMVFKPHTHTHMKQIKCKGVSPWRRREGLQIPVLLIG